MVVKLDEPQPTFDLPDLDTVLDCVDDKPDNTNTVLLHVRACDPGGFNSFS